MNKICVVVEYHNGGMSIFNLTSQKPLTVSDVVLYLSKNYDFCEEIDSFWIVPPEDVINEVLN